MKVLDRVWWLLPGLVALGCLSVFWSFATPHLCYTKYWLAGDSGIAVYNAWQVADGRLIHHDFFEYRTPLFFFVYALVLKLAGPSPAAAQWTTILVVSAAASAIAAAARRLGASRLYASAAGVVPVVLCFAVWPFPLPPWLGWLFAALAFVAIARAGDDSRRLFVAGLTAGLYVMTIQSNGLFFAAGATLGLLVALPRPTRVGWFVAGGLAAAAPFILYFAARGILGEALWQTLIWPNTHYYNGGIQGHYPLAGLVEHWERRGACHVSDAPLLNHAYTASVWGMVVYAGLGLLASLVVLGHTIWRRIRGVAATGVDIARAACAGAALVGLGPQLLFSNLSDLTHVAFACITAAAVIPALSWPRPFRFFLQAAVGILAALCLIVSIDRAVRWKPFSSKYADYDGFVKKYSRSQFLEELSEPDDTVVYIMYGGWQYLTSRRRSGVSHTAFFNDLKYTPMSEMQRLMADLRERLPTIMYFYVKDAERRFFELDPTLRQRYFWNGIAWERREPPLPHDTLRPRYRMDGCGAPGAMLEVTQQGQELTATDGATRYQGSVRGSRVFLRGGNVSLLLRRQPDETLAGELRGAPPKPCRLDPG